MFVVEPFVGTQPLRVSLTREDFARLIRGDVATHPKVEIVFDDIGLQEIKDAVEVALGEAARKSAGV